MSAAPPDQAGTADNTIPTKPIAWWLMQAIMVPAVPLMLVARVRVTPWAETLTYRGDDGVTRFVLNFFVFLALWALAISVSTFRRMPLARWIGGAFIAVLIVLSLGTFLLLLVDRGSDTPPSAAAIAAAPFMAVLASCWLYGFALSEKVRRYLGRA